MELDVRNNKVAALSSGENKLYGFQQKATEQQRSLIGRV
jgi:hypothetical protein